MHTLAKRRLAVAALLAALVPVALEVPALVSLALALAVLAALITYEAIRFAEARDRVRHQLAHD